MLLDRRACLCDGDMSVASSGRIAVAVNAAVNEIMDAFFPPARPLVAQSIPCC